MRYKALYFIAISLFIKVILFYFFWKCYNTDGRLYIPTGDTKYYLGYVENLLSKGQYVIQDEGKDYYAFRMPGLLFFYLPLRLVFNPHYAQSAFVILQTILSAISTYYLAKFAGRITGYTQLFWPVFVIASIAPYMANYNNLIITESLSVSFFIFSLYLLAKKEASVTHYFLAGLCFTIVVFLRPFLAPFWAVLAGLIYYLKTPQQTNRAAIKNIFLFILPFIIVDGAWTLRNLITMHQFVPLQTSTAWYKGKYLSREAKVTFVQSFGFHWMATPESQWTWLSTDDENNAMHEKRPGDEIFPDRTFVGGMTMDSLKMARTLIACAEDEKTDSVQRKACDTEAARILNKFVDNLKKDKPVDYILTNRIRTTLNFLHQPHSAGYPTKSLVYRVGWIVNRLDVGINYLVIYGGFIGMLLMFRRRSFKILFVLVPLYIIFIFCWVFRVDENRFLLMAYPFLLVNICFLLLWLGFKTGLVKREKIA